MGHFVWQFQLPPGLGGEVRFGSVLDIQLLRDSYAAAAPRRAGLLRSAYGGDVAVLFAVWPALVLLFLTDQLRIKLKLMIAGSCGTPFTG